MLLSDALIKSIENFDWHDMKYSPYIKEDYNLWLYVAKEFFGEYRGYEDYSKVENYYDEIVNKITARLNLLEETQIQEDTYLRELVNEARIAHLLVVALEPPSDLDIAFQFSGSRTKYEIPVPEDLEEKAQILINQYSSVGYNYESKFLDKISNAINGMVNDKVRGHTFSTYLFKLISDHHYSETSVYKAAGLNRQQFSKIRHRDYQPTKITAFALIIAMELSLEDAVELLHYAGFTFSPSSKLDRTIEFFVRQRIYDIDFINYVLCKNELPLLGSKIRNDQ